ncbi:hypothetical protein CP8484711_0435, partial [Chlamydia psittaci 84-8471/1]
PLIVIALLFMTEECLVDILATLPVNIMSPACACK